MRALYLPFNASASDSATSGKFEAGPYLSKLVVRTEVPICHLYSVTVTILVASTIFCLNDLIISIHEV